MFKRSMFFSKNRSVTTTPAKHSKFLMTGQLRDAESTLDESTKACDAHNRSLLERAETFKKQQADVDRRLLILTQSDTSDDAIVRFNSSMQRLQRLDVAQGYFNLLKEAHSLR
jgi:RAD50-interacting protein 1